MASGTVKSVACVEWTGRRNAKGYGVDGQGRLAHRLVVERVEGSPLLPGQIVMHRCDNPPCVEYSHLKRATQLENIADRDAKGRRKPPTGTSHPNARLSEQDIKSIRASGEGRQVLAARYGVNPHTIDSVRSRRSWRHL